MQFEQKTVTVGGKEYVLQKIPVKQALEMKQKWQLPGGVVNDLVLYQECLKNIVVSPKVTIDDFEEYPVLEELIGQCVFFQYMERKTQNPSKEK